VRRAVVDLLSADHDVNYCQVTRRRRALGRSAKGEMRMTGLSDQSHPVGTLPQAVRRNFSNVGYDEAMRRAR
jgi:hypothetical protein